MCVNYREAYGLHVSNGILFNSESARRGPGFVTRKITRGVARIALGKDKVIKLGNLVARRDWMHAKDAVRGMHLMLQQEKPDDYVLATGRSESVWWFLLAAADVAGINLQYEHNDPLKCWRSLSTGSSKAEFADVIIDPQYHRPTDVPHLCGDSSKARRVLGWQPTISLEELVKEMVECDLKREAGRA
jgi:GDPmannose 4,6-dehydratase